MLLTFKTKMSLFIFWHFYSLILTVGIVIYLSFEWGSNYSQIFCNENYASYHFIAIYNSWKCTYNTHNKCSTCVYIYYYSCCCHIKCQIKLTVTLLIFKNIFFFILNITVNFQSNIIKYHLIYLKTTPDQEKSLAIS